MSYLVGAPIINSGGGGPKQEYVLYTSGYIYIDGVEVQGSEGTVTVFSGQRITWNNPTTAEVTFFDVPMDGHTILQKTATTPYTVEAVPGATVLKLYLELG